MCQTSLREQALLFIFFLESIHAESQSRRTFPRRNFIEFTTADALDTCGVVNARRRGEKMLQKHSPLSAGGEFLQESGGVWSEVPDSQHLTPLNKSQQRAKDSGWLSIKSIRSCLGLSAATSLFPWFLRSGVSPSVFLDKQIGFLLKQAAAVPFDNNVIIQNK